MIRHKLGLRRGTLWRRIVHQTKHAIQCAALYSIETEQEFVEQEGVRFLVRVVASLARKDQVEGKLRENIDQSDMAMNPFLPYGKDLFVSDISETHLALLNKFNVIDYHLLIVTREFEDQETLLNLNDFEALWACLGEFESLGFYNAGVVAGASQRHKHLQIVPLPLANQGPPVPIEPLLQSASRSETICTLLRLPFRHAFTWLEPSLFNQSPVAARVTLNRYHAMLDAVGLGPINATRQQRQLAPYNLLVTRGWMLLVPRSREFFDAISVNALGFAGALLVRNEVQMQVIKDHGPMTVLRDVGVAKQS